MKIKAVIVHNICKQQLQQESVLETNLKRLDTEMIIEVDEKSTCTAQPQEDFIQIYPVSEGYLRKIPVERRGKYPETGIFHK